MRCYGIVCVEEQLGGLEVVLVLVLEQSVVLPRDSRGAPCPCRGVGVWS